MTSPDRRESGQIPPDIMNGLKSTELPMKGRLALITGSGRELGAETAIYLAGLGAQIIGNYRDERGDGGKKKRETDAVKAELGDKIAFVQGDISRPETTQKLTNEILKTGQKLDYLILNASGPNKDTNVTGNGALVDANLSAMNDGGVVVLLQSVPGHFDRQLSGLGRMPKDYIDVAPAKREGEELVRQKVNSYRIENPVRDIKLLVVCPPEIPDTQNIRMFDYHSKNDPDGNATQKHQAIANQLGLPMGTWNKREVAEKIGGLLVSGDFLSGYTEFFNGVEDVQTKLENWYGNDQVYVQTFQRMTGAEREKTGYVGIARSIVSKNQAERSGEPQLADRISDGGVVFVEPEHAEGHFKLESGLPLILPGHKQIRAGLEIIAQIDGVSVKEMRLKGFDGAEFKGIVDVNYDDLFIDIHPQESGARNIVVGKIRGEKVTANVDNMRVEKIDFSTTPTLLEDQLIEGSAQAAGVALLPKIDGQSLPLFMEMGRVEFTGLRLKAGAGVEYRVKGKGNRRVISGDVEIYSNGEKVGEVNGLKAMIVSRDKIPSLLD